MKLFTHKKIFYLFFFFCIINSFLIFFPNFNFSDQPSINIHLHKNLIDYQKEDTSDDFIKYYNDKYKKFHEERYQVEYYNSKYGIMDEPHFNRPVEKVKVTTRLLEFIPYKIFNGSIDIEKIFVFSNFLILILTLMYFYKFGKIIINKEFGIILMILVVSNVYFNQLLRSSMQNEILVYPLLLSANFYYLFKFFIKKKSLKTIFLFGFFIALNFNNGYPNSTAILLPLTVFQFIFLYIFSSLNINNRSINRPSIQSVCLLFLISIIIILSVSIFWSLQNGFDPFYLLSLSGTRLDRIYGSDGLAFATGSIIDTFSFYSFYDLIINFFKILTFPSHAYNAPHEPGFLFKISYISIIEFIFFLFGIFYIFRKLSFNNYIKFFLLGILSLIILRSLTDKLIFVNKGNYDVFFLIHFFSALGILYFPYKLINLYISETYNLLFKQNFRLFFYENLKTKLILFFRYGLKSRIDFQVNNNSENDTHNHSSLSYKNYKFILLFIILLMNSYNFNYKFVYKGNENLGLHGGLYQAKKFINANLEGDNNLLIVNWLWSDVFFIDLITDIKANYKVDVLTKEIFTDNNYVNYYKNFDKIYFLQPGETATVANRNFVHGGRSRINSDFHEFFSFRNYKKIIRDRQGKPLYYITELSNIIHKNLDKDLIQNRKFNLNLSSDKLNYFDIPIFVENFKLSCNGEIFDFNFSNSNASFIHLNFIDNSVIEIYNDLDKNNKSLKKYFNVEFANAKNESFSWQSNGNYIFSKSGHDGNYGYLDFKHKFPLNIKDATITIPYMLFNDANRNNLVEFYFKDKKNFKIVERIISDKSNQFGVSTWDPPASPFQNPIHSRAIDYLSNNYSFKENNLNELEYRLSLRRQLWGFNYATRFISTSNQTLQNRPFYIIANAEVDKDIKNSINQCNNEVEIEFELNNLYKKYEDLPFNYGLLRK